VSAVRSLGDDPPEPAAVLSRGDDRPEVPEALRARAARLLLWYPAGWRARYGEEFSELLAAELAEQSRSLRRTADVACCGMRARLAGVGLAGHPLARQGRRERGWHEPASLEFLGEQIASS
jgi:hypothetical protein